MITKAFNALRPLLGSLLVVCSIALFIPAPPSYEGHVYSLFPLSIIQTMIFLIGRPLQVSLNWISATQVIIESSAFFIICLVHVMALNLLMGL